jgi:flagellar basal-body rod protein FlgF/flagellar basal-body rod protein FlgG
VDSGYYAACAGLLAKSQQLEMLAHNLANSSTTGYKSEQTSFRSFLAMRQAPASELNRAINAFGVSTDPRLNLAAGATETTGNSLDVAVEGPGFLAVSVGKQDRYTRNGHLQLSSTGELVTSEGNPVLGDAGPLRIPPGATVTISPDGEVSANGALIGRLKLVELDGAGLDEIAPGIFSSSGAVRQSATSRVRQGALEASNVNGVEAAVGLVALQRHAEMLQRALAIFHSEFNRIAATELPRV